MIYFLVPLFIIIIFELNKNMSNSNTTSTSRHKTLPPRPMYMPQLTCPCSQCKIPIPTTQQFKLCPACREKGRINSTNYSKQAREQDEMTFRFQASVMGEGDERVIDKKSQMEGVDAKGKGKLVDMSDVESMVRCVFSFYTYQPDPYTTPPETPHLNTPRPRPPNRIPNPRPPPFRPLLLLPPPHLFPHPHSIILSNIFDPIHRKPARHPRATRRDS